jgi:hypothetical protein
MEETIAFNYNKKKLRAFLGSQLASIEKLAQPCVLLVSPRVFVVEQRDE